MAPPKIHQRFVKQGIWRFSNSPATWPLAPRDKEGGQLSQSVEGRAGQGRLFLNDPQLQNLWMLMVAPDEAKSVVAETASRR